MSADNTDWLPLRDIPHCENPTEYLTDSDSSIVAEETEVESDIDQFHEDAVEYLAGYLIRKLKLKDEESTEANFTWVDQVSGWFGKTQLKFCEGIGVFRASFRKDEWR